MTTITNSAPPDGENLLPYLVSICRWGRRFYSEAAEVSRRREQAQALQYLELQRETLVQDLQQWIEPDAWSESALIPQVRASRHDDARILDLCDRIDGQTLAAYETCVSRLPAGSLRSVLLGHMRKIREGVQRRQALRTGP